MNSKRIFTAIIAFLFLAGNVFATNVISAKDFVQLRKDNKNVVVIDASKAKLYSQSHIKGAINIPYASLNTNDPVYGLLMDPTAVAEILGQHGVANDDIIVVYDEGSQKYSSRVYWILKYLGAKDVRLLHKNMDEFRKARIPLTSEVPSVKAKTFSVNLDPSVYADAAYIESVIGNPDVIIIDARTPEEYNGTGTGKNEYSKGHIEGAINIPYESTIVGDQKDFVSPEAFKALAPDVTFTPDKQYIVYCKTGVKGSAMYALLFNEMGFPNVKMYDGSYLDWEANGKPVVK